MILMKLELMAKTVKTFSKISLYMKKFKNIL